MLHFGMGDLSQSRWIGSRATTRRSLEITLKSEAAWLPGPQILTLSGNHSGRMTERAVPPMQIAIALLGRDLALCIIDRQGKICVQALALELIVERFPGSSFHWITSTIGVNPGNRQESFYFSKPVIAFIWINMNCLAHG